MERNARAVLAHDERAAAAARDFVTDVLTEWERTELIDDARLLVDELVLNAVTHVPDGATYLDLRAGPDLLRICVIDSLPDFQIEERSHPDDVPRLGLRIVDSVSSRWGVDLASDGKSVWVELESPTANG